MRITNICLLAPVTDGWNYQDNLLPKYQKKNGHDVTIITSHWVWNQYGKLARDEREEYVNEDGVKILRIEMSGKDDFTKKFKKYPSLYESIEKTNPEFLFIHGLGFVDTSIIVKYLKDHPKVNANADNHADFSNSATNWISKNILHKLIWRHYAQKLVPYVGKFYGVLPARVDFMADIYNIPEDKCDLLVMGADDELVENFELESNKSKARLDLKIKKNDFLIVTGGKIDIAKSQTLLLMEAVNRINVKNNKRNIKLLIFGPVSNELKDKFESLLTNNIYHIDWADTEKSYLYLSISDLVIFPGRHSVYWEQAAGLGKPMIIKRWLGTNHIDMGGNVIYLETDSADEIESNIEKLVNNKEKYKYMKNIAEKNSKKYFSYKNIAKRSIKI